VLDRAARYDDDFDYADDAYRPGLIGRVFGVALRHPGRTAMTVLAIAAAGVIVANAVFFQTGEHPSPLFTTRTADAPAAAPAAAPPAAAPAAAPAQQPATRAAPVDEIGRLVEVTAVGAPQVAAVAASPVVVEVQQLLTAQGYQPGAVDGLFGTRTENAIRAYQADHRLAVTGEISETLLAMLRSTGTAAVSPNATLATEGLQLLAVQTALNQIGYGPIAANGMMSDETANAVRGFQLEYGLTVTGRVDQATIDRLVAIGALEQP
jgi:peptidoglycan hydrolase-like protein with peptidoglycan-binding domain